MTNMELICFCCTMIVLAFLIFLFARRSSNSGRSQAALSDGQADLEEVAQTAVNPMVRNNRQRYREVSSGWRVNPMVRDAAENLGKEIAMECSGKKE